MSENTTDPDTGLKSAFCKPMCSTDTLQDLGDTFETKSVQAVRIKPPIG